MKKKLVVSLLVIVVLAGVWAGVFFWKNFRGAVPALKNPSLVISEESELPISLPPGFSISVFAKGLPNARVMVKDYFGNFWVSQPSEGLVSTLEVRDGKVTRVTPVFRDLKRPHGLAIDPSNGHTLYIAEEDKISRVGLYSDGGMEKIADLPLGGHSTRTIAFGPDGRLYFSIGSTCNVCHESEEMRAKIFSMKKDGTDMKEVARGLRNSVFFTWSYVDGRMWATDMGRDLLGDNIPPEEINIIKEGGNYGWPICYGKNIHDTNFDKNTYIRNPCMEPLETPSYIDIQAHSAPLGLAFVPEEGWPEEYWYDLVVAYHGSWNRTVPTGYKLARIKLDAKGNYEGMEDFATGWLTDKGDVIGRPVAVLAEPGGIMYVTDDKAGVIYKIVHGEEKKETVDKSDLIVVNGLKENSFIKSPLVVEGKARGVWYFEASFPIKLYDGAGKEIAIGIAQAQSDWMTKDFVPFKAQLEFKKPATPTGTLVLQKDNPSGLPEKDDSISISVRF